MKNLQNNVEKLQHTAEKLENELVVDEKRKLQLQVANCVSFTIAMIFNGLAQVIAPVSLDEIAVQWDLRIEPATWAFTIWIAIYTLLAIFTVY